MSRTKLIVSEDVEKCFGVAEIITYPGLVGKTDADGQPLYCSGEITFNIIIAGRTTSVTAWVTNAIESGQLIIGSGTLEDLGLHLHNVRYDSNPRGHARETRTIRIPGGGSALTRSARTSRRSNTQPQQNEQGTLREEENNFLIPFHLGFQREVVIGSNDKRMSIYYVTPNGKVKIPSKSAMGRHLGYNPIEGFSVDDFCYTPIILDIDDPELETLRMAGSRRSIVRSTPQMGASPQLAYSDDSALTANDVYNENRSDPPSR